MKYVHCDCCGARIYFGNIIYQFSGRCGVYCSKRCFAESYADTDYLTEEVAEDCMCDVFEEKVGEV